ncbi:hypothetical protein [Microbacterium sp. 10M-3C3]|uniref:hypothetical protein n=1 Tax=Microbacterium sp. 10M-3C3 TaxID=2483401 RepID=UPI000F6376AD|nr:hypothetical protein [Microbacterium sp. 10M-3C3]
MSSGLRAEFDDLFAGRPDELSAGAAALQRTADAIERAAEGLRDLVDDQRSRATDAARDSAVEAEAGLRRAHRRYDGVAGALTTFAVGLDAVQREARATIEEADAAADRSARLAGEMSDLQNDIVRAEATGASTTTLSTELTATSNGIAAADRGVSQARQTLWALRTRLGDAVERAVNAIETANEHGADSWGDNWNQFWGGVGDFFEMLGEWASTVPDAVVASLKEALSALVSTLVVALLLLIAALVLGWVVATVGLLGLLVVLAGVGILLLAMLIGEVLRGPRRIDDDRTSTAPTGDPERDAAADEREARDYQDLMKLLSDQDSASSGGAHTQIAVVAVRDADGNVISWRVQLPSTQQWSPFNTGGALNDLRTDVMLSIFPGVPTQYEEAVWDAMTEAGVFESDAPIMFTGWSLGGMMAGDLAADPRVADRVQSVVTAGSAIDKHYSDIPDGVRVTQFNNGIDPVHTLEFAGLDPIDALHSYDPDWQTYRPLTWPMHDATMYGAQAEHYLPEPRPGDGIFFAEPGAGSYEDVYYATYQRGS